MYETEPNFLETAQKTKKKIMSYLIVISSIIVTTISSPVLADYVFNAHKLSPIKVILILISKYRQPCKNCPDSILFTDMVRACPSTKFITAFSKSHIQQMLIRFKYNNHDYQPVPKLSSPQIEHNPASIKLPKNFQPVGTYHSMKKFQLYSPNWVV